MGIIILIGLAIGYIVLAYFAAKTWQATHVVLLVALFFASVGFSIMAAATLKTHAKYRSEYKKLKANLDVELKKKDQLINGNPLAGEDADPALRVLEGDVRRSLVDRGRVWRHLSAAGIDGNTLTLDASNWGNDRCQKIGGDSEDELEPIPEGAATGTKPLAINQGAILFAFRETPITEVPQELKSLLFGEGSNLAENDTNGLCKLPTFYLGEYRVKAIADDNSTLTLESVQTLEQENIDLIQGENFTWVLYEKMPLDAHEALTGLTADQLKILMPASPTMDAQQYATFIAEYSRDQQRAEDADLPERKWYKVRFAKTYDVDVDVPDAVPEPNQAFDATGRSQSALLNQTEKTSFNEGDEVMLDFETATRLQNDAVVEFIEPIYVRRLRDYEQAFRFFFVENSSLATQIGVETVNLKSLQDTNQSLQGQIAFRDNEKTNLIHDKEGFDKEQQVITAVHEAMKEKKSEIRKQLSQLYRVNKQLAQQAGGLRPVSAN